ncbi:hypothetical protein BDV25DRAFT_165111 [Aspergillus avenaceus]|uniref:Uncharacterized protein n=1 Tax=Aspergillus avenaceus TaxID=36643 RepID=A0A5N6TGL9_ASPAV|nr:hypothetical protein BDV25DRAFT_165111 [Aspergillus avenaceus]
MQGEERKESEVLKSLKAATKPQGMARVNYGDNEWIWSLLGVWLVLGGPTLGLVLFFSFSFSFLGLLS